MSMIHVIRQKNIQARTNRLGEGGKGLLQWIPKIKMETVRNSMRGWIGDPEPPPPPESLITKCAKLRNEKWLRIPMEYMKSNKINDIWRGKQVERDRWSVNPGGGFLGYWKGTQSPAVWIRTSLYFLFKTKISLPNRNFAIRKPSTLSLSVFHP
jgi:hypothetical protein